MFDLVWPRNLKSFHVPVRPVRRAVLQLPSCPPNLLERYRNPYFEADTASLGAGEEEF